MIQQSGGRVRTHRGIRRSGNSVARRGPRAIVAVAVGITGFALPALLGVPIAAADVTCPSIGGTYVDGNHAYSIAEYCAGANPLEGIEGQWHDSSFTESDSQDQNNTNGPNGISNTGFEDNEMWLPVKGNADSWVEEGVLGAYSAYGGYTAFWADAYDYSIAPHVLYFHNFGSLDADGSNHVYEIENAGIVDTGTANNNWYIYLDYNKIGTSTITQSSQGHALQVGMEVNDGDEYPYAYDYGWIDPDEYSGTFNDYMEVYYPSTGWEYPSAWSATADTFPCGTGSGYYPDGYCENGVHYYSYEWSDNKPSS
jgi:hypothetical protein